LLRSLLLAFVLLTLPSCQSTLTSQTPPCGNLQSLSTAGLQITGTEAITDRDDLPAFCAIRGTIKPSIGFEARFPIRDWNGKYYQSGCGGYCGSVLPDKPGFSNTINEALKMGYASITTDAGHTGGLGDASWALNDPVAVELYAQKAIPLTYQAGLKLVEAYYGRPPRLEYFSGCSNGGRMAAKAAQEYPTLFDGILAGGSVLNLSQNGGIYGSWVVQANTLADGSRVLNRQNFAARLPLLESQVLTQCDATDGVIDGQISMPRQCTVDVSRLPRCNGAATSDCFTDVELKVLQHWYDGPQDSAGQSLYPGMPPGSERYWLVWFLDDGQQVAPGNALGGDYARYLGFSEPVDESYTALDFDFDNDPERLRGTAQLLDALNPDLASFRESGGKFLMWHGWQDPLVLPDQSVAYYEDLVAQQDGRDQTHDFFRLFMIPGHGHCWELPSPGPDQFNPITVLENWVEKGQAPDALVLKTRNPDAQPDITLVCPYPNAPIYVTRPDQAGEKSCQ